VLLATVVTKLSWQTPEKVFGMRSLFDDTFKGKMKHEREHFIRKIEPLGMLKCRLRNMFVISEKS
jgi:hypothetical protein